MKVCFLRPFFSHFYSNSGLKTVNLYFGLPRANPEAGRDSQTPERRFTSVFAVSQLISGIGRQGRSLSRVPIGPRVRLSAPTF